MVRTQIQLTQGQTEALKRRAARERVSMAELIRRSVDRMIAEEEPMLDPDARRRALGAVGSFRSGLPDLAQGHDKYLAEAYLE
jgi:hypothetical protein